jgi:hypothetical protein
LTNKKRWFRWSILFVLLNSAFVWLLFINHAFALWSEPDCAGWSGISCKNIPAKLGMGDPLPQNLGDAGDAPDRQLAPMVAYTYPTTITADFPTMYVPGIASGPYHFNAGVGAYLGTAVSGETNAHQLPDHEGFTNINPLLNLANGDAQDDALDLIMGLESLCGSTRFTYTVTIEALNTPFYLNMWLDFNRDGTWGYADNCGNEWAIQNLSVNTGGGTGTFARTVSILTTNSNDVRYHPLWLRVTLSDRQVTAPEGYGPPEGFLYGETEDYFFRCVTGCDPFEVGDNPIAGWRG